MISEHIIPKASPHNDNNGRKKSFTKRYYSSSLVGKFPLKISFSKFHVTRPNRAGYNKIYEIRRSRSYFFELNDLPTNTNDIHLRIHTNDYHMKSTPIFYHNTSCTPNDKYRISCMLTHFFSSQRVLPRKVQQKFFPFIRDRLLARKDMISSRANSSRDRNTTTRTFFNFTYKRYRFYFGLYIPCCQDQKGSPFHTPSEKCQVPSPFVMSRCRRACVTHQSSFFKNEILNNVRQHGRKTK
ncbi:hypothetical protein RhiirA4_490814, partial [Rhizophagus irregularis]